MKKWSKKEDEILKLNYPLLVQKELSLLFPNRTSSSIYHRAEKLKLSKLDGHNNKIGMGNRKYLLNHNFFSTPNEENCYWAGFIAADGHLVKNTLQINLSIKDIQHLEKFLKSIQYTGSIHQYKNGGHPCASLRITSKSIVQDLNNIFNIPSGNKNKRLLPLKNFSDINLLAFIKGYIDGDGWVGRNKIGICSPEKELLKWIKYIFDTLVPHTNKNQKNAANVYTEYVGKLKTPFYKYQISGKRAFEIQNILKKCNTPSLNRKWE